MESKPHIGVRAVITEEEWSRISHNGIDNGDDREIMFFIIRQLMKKSTLTAQRLSEQYYIGRGQLDKILDRVAEWFSENHILLEIRRSKGISISYSEFNYRMVMLKFCSEFWDMYVDIISPRTSVYSEMPDDEYTGLCAALNGFDADSVAKIIVEIEESFGLKFNYISNKNLIFLISISVLRYRSANQIQMPNVPERYTDGISDKYISDIIVQKLNERLYWIYIVAFVLSVVYCFICIVQGNKKYQTRFDGVLILILCFLAAGIGLQMLNSEIRVDFMCVAIGNLLLYNYRGNIVNHIDMTTQLLNRICVLR